MNPLLRGLIALLLALTAGAMPAFAQSGRAVIVAPEVIPPEVASFAPIVEEAIAVDLERRGYTVVESGDGADVAISVEYRLHPVLPRLHVSLVVRDPVRNLVIAGASAQARANVTLYTTVSDLVDQALAEVDSYRATVAIVDTMILPVTLPPPLPPPEAPRDLSGGRSWGVQMHTSLGKLVGAGTGVRYRALNGRIAAMGELDLYTSGVVGGAPRVPTHIEPRLMVEGIPFSLFRDRFHLGVGTGFGAILTTIIGADAAPYLDTYWNVVSISLTLQLNRFSWFTRAGAVYSFESDRGFFVEGIGNEGSNPLLSTGVVWWL